MTTPIDELRAAVEAAAGDLRAAAGAEAEAPPQRPTLERPPRADFGDYSTNAAMLLAPVLGRPPRVIAEELGGRLLERLVGGVAKVDVAGPGFLNVFLADDWYAAALGEILAAGPRWGAAPVAKPETVIVEFVSANPTGPMTAASGRHGAFGDSLARLLDLRGHDVQREYYVNDYGGQVRKLGESVLAQARGEQVPPDGYVGDYVAELAARIPGAAERPVDELARAAVDLLLEQIEASMERFGVRFDTWYRESALHEGDPSPVQHAIDRLAEEGHTYGHEGALWLRTTTFGDDKDRVLRKSDGETTYFASDMGYLLSKAERGADRQINVLGSDHHGYVGRMKAAFQAFGLDAGALEIPIMQFVNIVERGERTSMSKRRGDFVTLDELVGDIGSDATRFFMLQRSHDTMVDLDLDLAREQSEKNPVYYAQYAHARTARVLRLAREEDGGPEPAVGDGAPAPLHASEKALIKKLLSFPAECAEAADRRAPHKIAAHAIELGQDQAAFYRDCPVRKAETEELKAFRLALCEATRQTLASALGLLGVSAPDEM